MIAIMLSIILGFLIVILIIPETIKMLQDRGRVGVDVHKPNRPTVPKGAGFVILFAIVATLLAYIGLNTFADGGVNKGILAALVSILMAGMIGLLDDTLDFRNRTKIVLPLVASIPMMAMQIGTQTMNIPFVGAINLGILYPLLVVPLMMTFIIDSTNMYGGMNGLESGLAIVNSSAIVVYIILSTIVDGGVIKESLLEAGIIAGSLLGATLAFYIFNRFPARVLPGDVGRLPIGAATAAALILGNMNRLAIILYSAFMVNFILFIIYKFQIRRKGWEYAKFAEPREDRTLEVIGPYTMYWILPHFFSGITEQKNVRLLIALQAIIAYAAVVLLIIGQPLGVGWI